MTRPALASLLLGYLLLVIGVITLAPFRFHWPDAWRLAWIVKPLDVAANVLLFVPLGFLCRLSAEPPRRLAAPVVLGLATSSLLEAVQVFLPGRYPSPVDVLTNTAGAGLGALAHQGIERWLTARMVRELALELPLINLVYLLIPLLWLSALAAGGDPTRLWLTPLLGLFGGGVLVALWRHRLGVRGTLSANGMVGAAVAWFVVGSFPGLVRRPWLVAGSTLALAVVLRADLSWPAPALGGDRRFELPTLRRVWPLYAAYLALVALWPWPWAPGPWRGALNLELADTPGVIPVLRLLEYLAGFTLVGYMAAETRGRRDESLPRAAGWVVLWCFAGAGCLEVIRGFHPRHTASLLQILLATTAALYGAMTYRLQLATVRRLLAGEAGEEPASGGRRPHHDRAR